MSRAPRVTDSATHPAPAGSAPEPPTDPSREYHICPFCGLTREINLEFDPSEACPRCTLTDSPTTRNATKARIGPWHVRQVRNPWAPGMRFETLLSLIKHGQVNAESIVRGPTTHQLWKRAANVRGLSREFGLCFSCGAEIDTQASLCPHCNRLQDPPANPDLLVDVRETIAPVVEKPVELEEQVKLPLVAPVAAPAPAVKTPVAAPQVRQTANPQAVKAPPAAPVQRDEDVDQPAKIDIGGSAPAPGTASSRDPLAVDEKAEEEQRPAPSRPRPLRPRVPGADDALLTPQELAQAFQLDFAPAPTPRKPRGTKVWTWAIFLLLVGGGTALLLHLRPDYRAQAAQWSSKKAESVKTFVESRTNPAPGNGKGPQRSGSATPQAAGSPAMQPTTRPKPGPIASAPPAAPAPTPSPKVEIEPPSPADEVVVGPAPTPRPVETHVSPPAPAPPVATPPPVVATPPLANAKPQAGSAISPSPATKPAAEARVAAAPATKPAEVVAYHAPAPPPAPVVETPVPKPPPTVAPDPVVAATAKPQAVQLPAGDPETQARTLWRQAIDAEANQDFLEAVQCYDLIKKLPEDVQPPGIDVRLKMARKQLK